MSQPKRSLVARLFTLAKWTALVLVVVFIINWVATVFVARGNQAEIDRFFEQVGATSFRALVDAEARGGEIAGNGWHLYLGALSLVSKTFIERSDLLLAEKETLTEDEREALENQLDRAHGLLEEARRMPYCMPDIDFNDPLSMDKPPLLVSLHYVELVMDSAAYWLRENNLQKAGDRFSDAITMIEGTMRLPTVFNAVVYQSSYNRVIRSLGKNLQLLPEETLEESNRLIQKVDLKKNFSQGMIGEVFWGLACWDQVLAVQQGQNTDPFTFLRWDIRMSLDLFLGVLLELDKAVYLDLMIPLALDFNLENARRINGEAIPWYAWVTSATTPMFDRSIQNMNRSQARWAVLLEAIRLELGKRQKGIWPEIHETVRGVPIEATLSGECLAITSPWLREPGNDEKEPFQVLLR